MPAQHPVTEVTSSQSDWLFYRTSGDAWDAMYEACAAAKKTIDFEQYIFKPYSKVGRDFIELFKRKAAEGVYVRLLADTLGSVQLYLSPWVQRELRRAGVDVLFFNPLRPWKLGQACGIFPRDHRKITVVDDEVLFMGGVCIDESMRQWRDTHVKVVGPLVKEVSFTFNSIWGNTKRGLCHTRIPDFQKEKEHTLFVNEPTRRNHQLRDKLLKRLSRARSEVFITTPYFVPARSFTRLIYDALERGVKVSIMTSGHCNPISYALGKLEAGKFIRRGARVYSYTECMIHTKTTVIDDDFVAVGSFNVDSLSFYRNQEADIVSTDPAIVAEFRRHFQEDMRCSREITYREWKNRHWYQKLLGQVVLPFRRYL
jgi:cardiolipin synthase